jgi:hypothetical protein
MEDLEDSRASPDAVLKRNLLFLALDRTPEIHHIASDYTECEPLEDNCICSAKYDYKDVLNICRAIYFNLVADTKCISWFLFRFF